MKHFSLLLVGLQLMASLPVHAADFTDDPFSDVPERSAHYQAIEYLRTGNVLRGYPDGTFQPDRRITRAEFIRLAVNPFFLSTLDTASCIQANTPAEGTTVFFDDVPRDAWYGPELCVAKTREIIDGYPDGTFKPNQYISLVEAVKIASNVFVANVKNDEDGVRWYRPYVKWVADYNAIPTSITSLTQPITRGEMAELFYRLKVQARDLPGTSYDTLVK